MWEWAGYGSPSEGRPDEVHIPVNLGAVPEELNIGGIYSYGVDQSPNPDAITDWRRKDCQVGALAWLSSKQEFGIEHQLTDSTQWSSKFIIWGFNTIYFTVATMTHFYLADSH